MMRKFAYAVFALTVAGGSVSAAPIRSPLYFEPNKGQAHPSVEFVSRGNGVVSYLTAQEAVLRVGRSPVRMHFLDAGASKPEEIGRLRGSTSYFNGNDPANWRTSIPQYAKIRYRSVYPGIDLVYYGSGGELEYDFEVAPGADLSKIRIAFHGANVKLGTNGDLVLASPDGILRQKRPVVYQERDGKRVEIAASYKLDGNNVRIKAGPYDNRRKLTVDPVLEYSTFFGSSGQDSASAVKVDASGNVYIAGTMPTPISDANPFAAASSDPYAKSDAVVIKFAPASNEVLFVAHIRAGGRVIGSNLAIDAQGATYLSGTTDASDFPLVNPVGGRPDSGFFVPWLAKISSDGAALVYSTLLSGRSPTSINAVAVDEAGNAYATGATMPGGGFPWSDGVPPQTSGVFIAKLSSDGALVFARPYQCACTPTALAVSSNGIYAAGTANPVAFPQRTQFTPKVSGKYPMFATKFSADGDAVIYASMFGGSGTQVPASALVDVQGNLYLAGATNSTDFPMVNPSQSTHVYRQDGFIVQLNPQGNGLLFSTYLGGSSNDRIEDLALDRSGDLYVAGVTDSPDFPTVNPVLTWKAKPANRYSQTYGFVAKFAATTRALVYSTLLGGTRADAAQPGEPASDRAFGIALDTVGKAYVVGSTYASDFPVANAFQSRYAGTQDMFLSVLAPEPAWTMPSLSTQPSLLTFTVTAGGAAPAAQVLTASSPAATAVTTASGGSWLNIVPTGGSTGAATQFTVSVNSSGLAVGNYSGAIGLSSGSGVPASVPVTLRVLAPVPVLTAAAPETLQPVIGLSEGIKVTISGSSFRPGAFATVMASYAPPQDYPVTVVNSGAVELQIPGGYLDAGRTIVVTISNAGTAPSNPVEFIVGRPAPIILRVANAASLKTGPISAGQILTIQGTLFGVFPESAPASPPVTTLGRVRVLFDGVAAPLLYVAGVPTAAEAGQTVESPLSQANVVAPLSLAGKVSTVVQVEYRGVLSPGVNVPIVPSSIGLFTADGSGVGQATALNEDGTQNTVSSPASTGSTLMLFATGISPGDSAKAAVAIDGEPAEVLSTDAGQDGVQSLTIRIPPSIRSGSAVPVAVRVAESTSQSGVTVSIQSTR